PPSPPSVINTRAWRAAEIPSSNGHTTARALARIYGALANGGALGGIRLLSATTIDAAIVEQSCGVDAILEFPSRFGLGFMLPLAEHFRAGGLGLQPFGPNPRAFGHWGTGGSVGFADLDGHIGLRLRHESAPVGHTWESRSSLAEPRRGGVRLPRTIVGWRGRGTTPVSN